MSALPTGEQFEITHGDQRAVIAEVGATLRTYAVGGREILDGFEESEFCVGFRGQVLMPWPNRIRAGRYEWGGETHQLDISEVVTGNASHGLMRFRNWRLRTHEPELVVLEETLPAVAGYPFIIAARVTYGLSDGGLAVTAETRNIGPDACPYGVGFHPYLTVAWSPLVDGAALTVPAATRLVSDEQLIPVSSEPVAGTPFDLRTPRLLGDLALDDCFTDLARGADGLARIVLVNPDGSGGLTLWQDEACPYVMVYTGDTLRQPERRRHSIAIEPMSCAPNAFVSGDGLVRLEPGDTHVARWGIETF